MSSTASVVGRRIPATGTPTSSTRPSLDYSVLSGVSPVTATTRTSTAISRQNRAALREYYNLRANPTKVDGPTPSIEANSEISSLPDYTSYEPSELDQPDFDVEAYVKRVLEEQSLTELLETYSGLLREIRALDSERKALVYDNYSKLIAATETIGRMRQSVENGEPAVGTLSEDIESIYSKAENLKKKIEQASDAIREKQDAEQQMKKMRSRDIARRVLETPERVRKLIEEGNKDEATTKWEKAKKLLETWKERGVGGSDVIDCIEDGDAALRGEPPNERSWINIKHQTRDVEE
ncbi:Vacuolar protein sorting-associated protein 51-like protein [Golovinomyces cichoracearum]|uniref:Vacuolar protein sorting-associated protein 51 homolog n=1 Tax=Golovinomyces cichoracearum TaxID=62708 RepID=A0A420HFW4_9PEZI|nr:Vacuolar protein sorting-associated protein 51-like protein [Golovinomyces cichoracearum]